MFNELPDLFQDDFGRDAFLRTASRWDSTESALFVATVNDRDVGENVAVADNHVGRDRVIVKVEVFNEPTLLLNYSDQIWQPMDTSRTEQQVNIRCSRLDDVAFPLSHAPCHAEDELWLFLFEFGELAQVCENLLVGFLPNGASVDEYDVSLLRAFRLLVAHLCQQPRHYFAVKHIHLATEGLYPVFHRGDTPIVHGGRIRFRRSEL